MKSLMKTLCTVTGLICAVAATTFGFADWFSYDLLSMVGEMGWLVRSLFGASGVISLALYIMHFLGVDCGCE